MTIDSHCHLHDEKFSPDLGEVLKRARNADISKMVSIGCDIKTSRAAQKLAQEHGEIYFSAGFHPHEAKLLDDKAFTELIEIASDKKCVGIGECGLDYYYLHSNIDEQKLAFMRQIELALSLNLPLIIHLRDAFEDCKAILKKHAPILKRTVIHCFSGTLAQAKVFEELGCTISLSGIVTFKKPGELLEVAKNVALDRLFVETDAPYLAPHPLRGQRNEPAYIRYTLEAIANARSQSLLEVSTQIHRNTQNFFGI